MILNVHPLVFTSDARRKAEVHGLAIREDLERGDAGGHVNQLRDAPLKALGVQNALLQRVHEAPLPAQHQQLRTLGGHFPGFGEIKVRDQN